MGWFRKRDDRGARQARAIAEFWQWWGKVRSDVARAISSGDPSAFIGGFATRVDAIQKGLEWELTPGIAAEHGLVVTAAGIPELRSAAARWLAAAPPVDETWEYHQVRSADARVLSSTLKLSADVSVDLAQLGYGIAVDRERRQVDVTCYHPMFGQLPRQAQGQVTFLCLDWLLGEDKVETWHGEITWTAQPPGDLRKPDDLRDAVAAIAEDDQWALMSGQGPDGQPLLATAAIPLRSARWPRFDKHVAVILPYRSFNAGQLPIDGSLEALRTFENRLTEAIGTDGALVAHETCGRRRTLHYYVDSYTGAYATAEQMAPTWPQGRATVKAQQDPSMQAVRHLSR